MRRSIILAAAVLVFAALAGTPSGAAVNTTTDFQQIAQAGWGTCDGTGCVGGSVSARRRVSLASSGASATPTTTFEATAQTYSFVYNPCCTFTSVNYPTQVVSPTALNMDPIGNAATINVALNPTSGPAGTFDVSLSRPTYTSIGVGCLLTCVNPWLDPPSSSAHVDHSQAIGLSRFSYAAAGSSPVGPLPAYPNAAGSTDTTLAAGQSVTLP